MPKKKKQIEKTFEDTEKERLDREAKIDAKVATRTAKYDQDLKERARIIGINPDNFDSESLLKEAVEETERNISEVKIDKEDQDG